MTISVEDTSPTEVWLNVETDNLQLPNELLLLRNGDTSEIFSLYQSDTLIYQDSLLPSQTYTYQVSSTQNQASSNKVSAVTMDTTSHNFTWKTYTFGGQGGSSTFYDVAVIDENDIWAVGKIYTADDKYNAVHWNGSEWELKRIMYYIDPDQPNAGKISSACESIFVFSKDNFIVSSNVQIAKFSSSAEYELINEDFDWINRFTVNAIWGKSNSNFYLVGNNGNLAYYDGNSWQKIYSGSILDVQDIHGSINPQTGKHEILAVASELYGIGGEELIRIEGTTAEVLDKPGIESDLYGIWFESGRKYYGVGGHIYTTRDIISEEGWYEYSEGAINKYFSLGIDGEGLNDVVITGFFGEVLHYNGKSWRNYTEELSHSDVDFYENVDIERDLIVAVGQGERKAIILVGSR